MTDEGRHRGRGTGRRHLIVLCAGVTAFLITVVCAVVWLPGQVNVYFTPTDRPDVVYELWQYLILTVVGAIMLAAGAALLASAAFSFVVAFSAGTAGPRAEVGAWVGAWALVWFSAQMWLTIWLGNEHAEKRSWLELLLSFAGLAGGVLIVAVHVWLFLRHGKAVKKID